MTDKIKAADVLDTAKDLIGGDRAEQYGSAYTMFKRIADFWNTYLGIRIINPNDVGNMMALMKIARNVKDPKHLDSAVDACGYIALAHQVALEQPPSLSKDSIYKQ